MNSWKRQSGLKELQNQSSKHSSERRSIRSSGKFSLRQSQIKVYQESEEFDVDERVIRSSTNRIQKLEHPTLASTENSRIFNVLQGHFHLDLTRDNDLPNFDTMKPCDCIQYLGDLIGCEDHEENMISFWFLDTLSEVIRQGQLKGVSNENLTVISIWFRHLLKLISVYAPNREDFFTDVDKMLFEAENDYLVSGKILLPKDIQERLNSKIIDNEGFKIGRMSLTDLLPLSKDIDVMSDESSSPEKDTAKSEDEANGGGDVPSDKNKDVTSEKEATLEKEASEECAKLNEFAFLTEQLYITFGHRFKYEVIKTVFSTPPEIQPIIIVESMNFPKEIGLSEKQKQEINLKRRTSTKPKPGKSLNEEAKRNGKKGKVVKEQSNLAVERFKAELQELDFKRIDEAEKEATKHFFIRPLEDAVDTEYFQHLFPPKRESQIQPIRQSVTEKEDSPKKKQKGKK